MTTTPLTYSIDDRAHVGQLARPADAATGARPGVLVFHEAFGCGPHAIGKAEQLAGLGHVALAADMFGDGTTYDQLDVARQATATLRADRRLWRKRARAAYDALVAQPGVDPTRIAAIGYCFGGATAIELARAGAPLAAIGTFHAAVMLRMIDDQPFTSRVLMCVGAQDPLIPMDTVLAQGRELDDGRCDWQLHLYGGTVHSFTNPAADAVGKPEAFRYSEAADRRAWAALTGLLADAFA